MVESRCICLTGVFHVEICDCVRSLVTVEQDRRAQVDQRVPTGVNTDLCETVRIEKPNAGGSEKSQHKVEVRKSSALPPGSVLGQSIWASYRGVESLEA